MAMTKAAFLVSGALAITLTACTSDESTLGFVAATPVTGSAVPVVSVTPNRIPLTPVFGFSSVGCQPFAATFNLVVRNAGRSDLFLNAASFRFLDGSTVGASAAPIPSTELTNRFGALVIFPGSVRAFPFNERFGCSIVAPRSLLIDATFVDVGGRTSAVTVVASVG